MRPIKFRAWDKKSKRMHYSNLHKTVWAGGKELCVSTDDGKLDGDFIGMEYTGLKDKSGKKIYEGDILRIFDENYEVKVIQTETRMFVNYGYPDKHNGPAPDWVEVIGNIYENPELLKGA